MQRSWLAGIILALIGGALVAVASLFSLQLSNVFLSVGSGAVLATAGTSDPIARLAAFWSGVAVAVADYWLLGSILPLGWQGQALAIAIAFLACGFISTVSRSWLPFWAVALGIGAFAGTYDVTFHAERSGVGEGLWPSLASLALGFAAGFCAAVWVEYSRDRPTTPARDVPQVTAQQRSRAPYA